MTGPETAAAIIQAKLIALVVLGMILLYRWIENWVQTGWREGS